MEWVEGAQHYRKPEIRWAKCSSDMPSSPCWGKGACDLDLISLEQDAFSLAELCGGLFAREAGELIVASDEPREGIE